MAHYKKHHETITVYGLHDPRSEELRYVGYTAVPLALRLTGHIADARNGRHNANNKKFAWINELRELGLKPVIRLIETVAFDHREEREVFWIQHYRKQGCNLLNKMAMQPWGKTVARHAGSWETGFTPGPWSATEKGFVFSDAVKPSAVVVSCGDPAGGEITNGVGCMVGNVRGERKANANLIAAAPDMYRRLDEVIQGLDGIPQFEGLLREIRKTLAKARGESQPDTDPTGANGG